MKKNIVNQMDKPLIVHIITKLELGGAQRVTIDTLRMLDKRKFRTALISGTEGELIQEALRLKECSVSLIPQLVHPIKPFRDIHAFFILLKILRRWKPDVVHTHSSKAGLLGRWAALIAGVPVRVHSVHGWSFNAYQNILKRMLFQFFERITAPITTYFFLESISHIFLGFERNLLKKGKYSELPPGIDFFEFDEILKKKAPIQGPSQLKKLKKNGKKIVSMVACFKPQKAPLDFIKAAAIVKNSMKRAAFVLVGDGILRERIEDEINQLGLKNEMLLLGWRKDIAEIISLSDVIVLTSLWEGLPTVLPMAMRLGLPVVANRIDGCGEFIKHGVNGLLSEPGNPASIAANIKRALEDTELRKIISEKAFESTKCFEIQKTTLIQEKIYSNLLAIRKKS